MNINGFIYSAKLTNALASEVSENKWDIKLISELGTLRQLFKHMIRVRDVYRNGLKTGIIEFPGILPPNEDLVYELERSMEELASEFRLTKFKQIKIGSDYLLIADLLGISIQHEGIHQGQYYVVLKKAGLDIPNQWTEDWGM